MGPGPLIAIDVVLLYTILGPLVLFGIYVLFDSLDAMGNTKQMGAVQKDPALWTGEDLETAYLNGGGFDGDMDRI